MGDNMKKTVSIADEKTKLNSSELEPPPVVVSVSEDGSPRAGETDEDMSPDDPHSGNLFRVFSWNKDEDDMGLLLIYPRYKKWPNLLRAILYSVTGSAILMIPGIISLVAFVDDTGSNVGDISQQESTFTIDGYPVVVFSIYLCIIWTSWWGLRWAFQTLPELLARLADIFIGTSTSEEDNIRYGSIVSHYVEYMRFLKYYMAFFIWNIVNLVTWTALFRKNTGNESHWEGIFTKIWLCLIVASVVWLIEKFFLQVFAVQFHKRAYQERMAGNKMAYKALACLNKATKLSKAAKSGGGDPTLLSTTATSDWETASAAEKKANAVKEFGKEFGAKAVGVSRHIVTGLGQIFGAAVGIDIVESSGIVLRSPHDAKMLAKRIFNALTSRKVEYIIPTDFDPYFPNLEESRQAFAMFDKDGNGDISKQEMKTAILEIFRERQALEVSLRSSSQAMDKLDSFLKVIVYIIILFVSLSIWSVDTTKFLTAAISIWAGLLFAVGGTVKNLVESCIFLFVTHPYDVGDRVDVDDQSYIVKEFGLTSTILRRVDGKEIYAPNIVLASKFVHNVRRSGCQSEDIKINVSMDTSPEKIQQLRDHLLAFLAENGRDYIPKIEITISRIVDKNTLELCMGLEHKSNWQDGGKKAVRRNKFMFALKQGIEKFGIVLPGGPLNVELRSNYVTPTTAPVLATQASNPFVDTRL